MLFQSRKGCIKQQHKHIRCPNAVFAKCTIQRHEYFHTRYPQAVGYKKNCSPNKTMWLIAFAGELGDVVGRPLPHGILDTSEDPKSPDWCVPESFSICQGLSGGAWGGVRFRGEPTGLTLLRCKYERKLFLKSWKLFSASWKLFFKSPIFFLNPGNFTLNPGNYFLNPGIYFLHPRKYFLNHTKLFLYLCPKPRNHLQNKDCFYQTQPLDKDSSQSLEVQRLPQTSEPCSHREKGAARLLAQAFFILFRSMFVCSLTPHFRISHCFVLIYQSVQSFNIS